MSNPRLKPVEPGHSFFRLIYDYCLEERYQPCINRALHRLCSLMRKMNAKTVVIEDIESSCSEIKDECLAIKAYYSRNIKIRAHKFTFLNKEIKNLKEIPQLKDSSFLSSALIINFTDRNGKWKSYLFKAIVSIPEINYAEFGTIPLLNYYLHIYKTFRCKVSISEYDIHEFNIIGTFFCQQNSVTSVCAHASLCMTINNMNFEKIGLPNPGIVTAECVNKIVGIDHRNIKFGINKDGLSKEEIQEVLKKFELSITWTDFFENPNVEYNEYIYRYIESRCPVLLVFTTDSTALHVVPVLGHTLNSDMWRPEAEPAYSVQDSRLNYRSAAAWVDHFIIHDDNFGMYLCLPVDTLKRVTLPKHDPTFRANFAVVVLPSGVTTPAWEVEWASVVIVKSLLQTLKKKEIDLDEWSNRIISSDNVHPPRPIVVRTFLTTKENYAKSLEQADFQGNLFSESDKKKLVKDLPFRFWLSEITLPDLYTANKNKIIDFFMDLITLF